VLRPFVVVTREDIEREAQTVVAISENGGHPNVLDLLKHEWLAPSLYYFIDMELCDLNLSEYVHGERSKYLETCSETDATMHNAIYVGENCSTELKLRNIWTIMSDITEGIAFIHKREHVHRDLKPQNGDCRTIMLGN
jgi:serine/threonine protein kinase